MKVIKITMLVAMGLLVGCSVNPSELSKADAIKFVNKLKYAKDIRTGLCFAMIAGRRTAGTYATGFGITNVPCDSVEHMLVSK